MKTTNARRLLRFGFFILLATGVGSGCESLPRNKSHAAVPLSSIRQGKTLAATYCKSCHLLPDPSQLNATSWERGVLPNMGPRLGIFQHGFQEYPSARYDAMIGPDFYPSQAVLTSSQWQNIIDYYTATSPDTLPPQHRTEAISQNLSLFEPQLPALHYNGPMTSLLKIGTGAPLLLSDAGRQKTYFLNAQLQVTDSFATSGPLVDAQLFQNAMLACNIGVLNPNNGMWGKATLVRKDDKGLWQEDTSALFKNLKRPVQVTPADLNGDKRPDFLVCEFGFLKGSLCWMENRGSNNFQKHILRPLPGAVKAYVQDYNKDGLPDIWVLFAQGDEGIFLYTNKGNGQFTEQAVLRFPPSWGSSYFELADFNNDGFPDIVYTCGDNADYSPVLKPYHGVYLFQNDRRNHFKQTFFFPLHGCYKAMARDFDKDGDLDLATISYFADYAQQPEEGFVYLENKGGNQFQPYSLEITQKGRWLTMDAGDVNGDGWLDVVLGNFCLGPTLSKARYDWRDGPPFILLKNKGLP